MHMYWDNGLKIGVYGAPQMQHCTCVHAYNYKQLKLDKSGCGTCFDCNSSSCQSQDEDS